jgi:N-methylhydantoinase A/oxoprolinase/acetone carboxylase beta subunit
VAADLRLGIDVGGTNTDAVVLDREDRLCAKTKRPTTPDVTSGIRAAIDGVVEAGDFDVARIGHVMLGTTHATNAVLQRRDLGRVAVLRLAAPATFAVPPLSGWPTDLRSTISAGEAIVAGGIEFDGRELSAFDREAAKRFLGSVAGSAEAIAIVSVFAPVSERQELEAAELVRAQLGDVHVSLSHEIGSVGLLERENATVLNAALVEVAGRVAEALTDALYTHGIQATTFFAQNDGTLMALDYATRHPVLTIGSGPANSIRGAAYLTGRKDAIVADLGGTSTDVGVLVGGFPRESAYGVTIGGIDTNFRMPDLVTIALGGGTVISADGGAVRTGPRSVGFRLTEEALVFGGSTPTLTDAAVVHGRARLGEPGRAARSRAMLGEALERSDAMLADAIDRVKTSREDRPLIAVGGGSILVPDALPGVSEIHRPDHHDVANAIGAAIASVSGEVDRIFQLGAGGRRAAMDEASDEARERAVRAGADPDHVEIVEIEEVPLAYLTNPALRIRVKAAGPLRAHG